MKVAAVTGNMLCS